MGSVYVVPDIGQTWLTFPAVLQFCSVVCAVGLLIFQICNHETGKNNLNYEKPVLALHPLAWLFMLNKTLTNLIPTWHGTRHLVSFTSCRIQFCL